MRNILYFLLGVILFLLPTTLHATHIVGAQLYYECVNSTTNQYKVTLKLYRDCLNGQAPFDDPLTLFVFQATSGTLYNTYDIPVPTNTPQVQPTNWGPCVAVPPAVCVEEGIYITYINLPPLTGGYDIAWARCCRNSNITNLNTPQGEGVTFLAHVPSSSLASCNSMPIFNNTPPFFLCNNQTFSFDYSATDADGDSLVYQVTNPYTGTNFAGLGAGNPNLGGNQPVVSPGGNPMGPPPYQNVVFGGAFNFANPFGFASSLNLDAQTGLMTVTPTQLGIFVIAVSVFEYRNGVLLSENKQDVQIHVLNCLPQNSPPVITHDLSGLNSNGDTVFISPTVPFCFPLQLTAPTVIGSLQMQAVSPIFNGANPPVLTILGGINPLNAQICWTPACANNNQLVPLIIKGWDTGNCPGFGTAFDTIWIKIVLPPNAAPVITPDYTGLNVQNGNIVISATNQLCYDFVVADIEGDNITVTPTSPIFSGANPPVMTITGNNPLTGTICWSPDCSFVGQTIPITFTATDVSACGVTHTVTSTTNIVIQNPPNIPPVLTSNLAGTVNSGDTIYVNALSNFCYSFTGTDVDAGDSLTITGVSPVFSGANPPIITFSGINPIVGQVCWTPSCLYANTTIMLIIKVKDKGVCTNIGEDFDTVYVSIAVPPNSPPILSYNLAGTNFSNDTIYAIAENNLCFTFTGTDINPNNILTFIPQSPVFSGSNPPIVTINGNNPMLGQICWTPDCNLDGATIPFIFGVEDDGACNNPLSDYDTLYIHVDIPINNPPIITYDLNGTNFSNDTIYIDALSSFCYDFTVTDANLGDTLSLLPLSPIFNTPGGPSLTVSGTNPLQGQICWTPDCQYINQVISLLLEVTDDAICNTDLEDRDTVFIAITMPPNTAPTSLPNLSGNIFSNDTIYADAKDTLCFSFVFQDIDVSDSLIFTPLSPVFTSVSPPTLTITGVNPVLVEICWVPDCSYEGMNIPFIVQATDNGKCNNNLSVTDTIFIQISDPITAPPVIVHDLSGTFHIGDLIFVNLTDSICYDFYIADVTPENGMIYTYEFFNAITGQNLGLGSVATTYINDTIFGTVCFKPNCGNGGSTYNVVITGIDKANCPPFDETKDTVQIKVNTNFYALASNDTSICAGTGGVQLNVVAFGGTPGYHYTWGCLSPLGCGISNPYIPNPFVNPTDDCQVWVQLQDDYGCTSEIDTVSITVNEIPLVDAGPDTTICRGAWGCYLSTTILNASSCPGPYTYSWFPSAGLNIDTISHPYATPQNTTIYTVVVGDANGCVSAVTTLDTLSTITVTVNPRPIVEAGPDAHICEADSVQLLGYAYGAGPIYTYAWTPINGVSNFQTPNPMASPPATTTFTLVAWSNGCPSIGDTATVFVHTLPTINPGISYQICWGDSVQLTGIAGGDSTATYTFSWTPSDGLNNPHLAMPMASPDSTTTYQLLVESNYGCKSIPQNTIVTVLPTPLADAGQDALICGADSILLQGSFTFANGSTGTPVFAGWNPHPDISDITLAQTWAYPSQSTYYVYTAQYGICKTEDSVRIELANAFTVEANAIPPIVCKGGGVQLSVNSSMSPAAYTWSPVTGISDVYSQSPMAYPDTTTTYTVVVQAGACQYSDTITLEVKPSPDAAFFTSNPTICIENPEVQFFENATYELAYIWNFGDGSAVSNEPNPLHTYSQSGTYHPMLIAVSEGGCADTAATQTIVISPQVVAAFSSTPTFSDTVYLPEAVVQFQNLSLYADQYVWTFGDSQVSSDINPTHIFQESGDFLVTLTATNTQGCKDTVQQNYHIAPPSLFIPNIFTPNQDGVHDTFGVHYTGKEKFFLEVYDRWGVKMFESDNPNQDWEGTTPAGKPASDGNYYYVITIGKKNYTGYVLILR